MLRPGLHLPCPCGCVQFAESLAAGVRPHPLGVAPLGPPARPDPPGHPGPVFLFSDGRCLSSVHTTCTPFSPACRTEARAALEGLCVLTRPPRAPRLAPRPVRAIQSPALRPGSANGPPDQHDDSQGSAEQPGEVINRPRRKSFFPPFSSSFPEITKSTLLFLHRAAFPTFPTPRHKRAIPETRNSAAPKTRYTFYLVDKKH